MSFLLKETHATKNGVVMRIDEMDDEHLINTIKLHLKKLEVAKQVLSETENRFNKAFRKPVLSGESAEAFVRMHKTIMAIYVFELASRGLTYIMEFAREYQRITGRPAGAYSKPAVRLPGGVEIMPEELDDDFIDDLNDDE